MKIKCLIVDDEPLAIQVIENYLDRLQDFEIVASCESAIEAFHIIQEKDIDLLLLDINMPMLNGIEFLKSIENPPEVIFTTAYRDYAVESYELNVLDYLVKPIPFQRFLKALHKAKKYIELVNRNSLLRENHAFESHENIHPVHKEEAFIFLKVDKKRVKIALDDIFHIESLKDYIRVFTKNDEYIVHQSLTKITESLPEKYFMRVHRSYTISLRKVSAIDGNQVEINGKWIPIGRLYQQQVKEKLLK